MITGYQMFAFLSKFSLNRWQKIIAGLALGLLFGGLFPHIAVYLKVLGDLFIRAIHLLIGPVVFFSVVCAILSIDDFSMMRKVTGKAIVAYLFCMVLAALIGLFFFYLFEPGLHAHLQLESVGVVNHSINPNSVILNVLPKNALGAFLHDNVLQIVIFAILIGISIHFTGEAAKPVRSFFQGFAQVSFQLADLVMRFAPIGVFALIAWTVSHFGWHVLSSLALFIVTVYVACLVQLVLVYSILLCVFGSLSVPKFFKGVLPALLFAFSTSSSAATLPESMRCAERLGLSSSLSRFLLPLGASFNLNGLTIYLVIAVLFAANLFGIHFTGLQVLMLIVTTVFTAMGVAAVPGSALIAMGAIMSASGIPLGAIALIAGVDRLNDMMQTATNVAGDLTVTAMLASEKES